MAHKVPVTTSHSQDTPMRHCAAEKPGALRSLWVRSSLRTRLQVLTAALVMAGSASVLLEDVIFPSVTRDVQLALFRSQPLVDAEKPDSDTQRLTSVIEARTAVVLPPRVIDALPTDAPTPAPAPTTTQPPTFASPTERKCYYERDLGIISEIRQSKREFCERKPDEEMDASRRTQVTFVDLEAFGSIPMRAMVFHRDFRLDFTQATIHRPIASLAQDGGGHDPRFNWLPSMISCSCNEFQRFATDFYRASGNRTTLRPWDPTLAGTYERYDEPSTVCGTPTSIQLKTVPPPVASAPPMVIDEKTVVITRRDDHNPFFQVSSVLNAWLMTRTLGWKRTETRVIQMDGGYPSPIDELHYHLLSTPSTYSLLLGREHLVGHKLQFTNQVMIAPYETTGPLMQHLDDFEPCQRSQLITEFRAEALSSMDVAAISDPNKTQITVTIISRRNYGGRKVQRKLLNEEEILAAMRADYSTHNGLPIVFQAVEFVDLTLKQQMEITLNSDVVIGMHGAGMVNVLWTKPETLVVEIFPRRRFRWGYRNICQYVGCNWHEFRGGKDTGQGDNASDKTIPIDNWMAFFDPLFRNRIGMPMKTSAPSPAATLNQVPTVAPTPALSSPAGKMAIDSPSTASDQRVGRV